MTDEFAPVIALLSACDAQSQGLRTRVIGIDDVQVVDRGCSSIVPQGSWYQSTSARHRERRQCPPDQSSPTAALMLWVMVTVLAEYEDALLDQQIFVRERQTAHLAVSQ